MFVVHFSGSSGAGFGQVLRPGLRAIHVARDARGVGYDARGDGSSGASAVATGTTRSALVLSVAAKCGGTAAVEQWPTAGATTAATASDHRYRLSAVAGAAAEPARLSSTTIVRLSSSRQQSEATAAAAATTTVLAGRKFACHDANVVHVTRKLLLSSNGSSRRRNEIVDYDEVTSKLSAESESIARIGWIHAAWGSIVVIVVVPKRTFRTVLNIFIVIFRCGSRDATRKTKSLAPSKGRGGRGGRGERARQRCSGSRRSRCSSCDTLGHQ